MAIPCVKRADQHAGKDVRVCGVRQFSGADALGQDPAQRTPTWLDQPAAEGSEQFRVAALFGQQRADNRDGVPAQQVGAEVPQNREGAAAGRRGGGAALSRRVCPRPATTRSHLVRCCVSGASRRFPSAACIGCVPLHLDIPGGFQGQHVTTKFRFLKPIFHYILC